MPEQEYALIGHPVAHSMSPFLQARLFAAAGVQASYRLLDVPPGRLAETAPALRRLSGFNITIPYKQEIIPFLDALDEKAAFFGSVNTVRCEGGRMTGYTTDGDGFLFALQSAGVSPAGSALLLGAGGAARVMAYELVQAGAPSLCIAARSPEKAEPLRRELAAMAGRRGLACEITLESFARLEQTAGARRWDLLVNGTPVGMHPKTGCSPVSAAVVGRCAAVFDAVYNPDETMLLRLAREAGKTAVHGMAMLVGQAAKAQHIWNGSRFPREFQRQLCAEAVAEMNRSFGREEHP